MRHLEAHWKHIKLSCFYVKIVKPGNDLSLHTCGPSLQVIHRFFVINNYKLQLKFGVY